MDRSARPAVTETLPPAHRACSDSPASKMAYGPRVTFGTGILLRGRGPSRRSRSNFTRHTWPSPSRGGSRSPAGYMPSTIVPFPAHRAQRNRSLGSPLQRRASLATVLPARGDGRNYREWLDRSWCHAIVNAARTRGEALTTSRPSRPKIDQPLLIAPFSPRVRKDGRHRNLARSDRDPEDRFPSKLTARREGVLAGALRAGKRNSSYPYSGEAPASTPFRRAGPCVDELET